MSILLVLIPVTLLFVIVGGIAFFWAVNHDQFDDLDSPALQPLTDAEPDALPGGVRDRSHSGVNSGLHGGLHGGSVNTGTAPR